MRVYAVIPAGGKGTRTGSALPKQYLKVNGKELIVYTLQTFQSNKLIDEIIVPADPVYFPLLNRLKTKYKLSKLTVITTGGKTRQESVFNGLFAVFGNQKELNTSMEVKISKQLNNNLRLFTPAKAGDLVVVHDAARALLPGSVLTDAVTSAKKKGNALVCVRAKDTLIKGDKFVGSYLERDEVFYVQTPQIFRCGDLMNAMMKARKEKFTGTDESMLVARLGKRINIVEGSAFNFKITTKEDLKIFRKLARPTPNPGLPPNPLPKGRG